MLNLHTSCTGGVKLRNEYKGTMGKDSGEGGNKCGRGVGKGGESNGGKWGQL